MGPANPAQSCPNLSSPMARNSRPKQAYSSLRRRMSGPVDSDVSEASSEAEGEGGGAVFSMASQWC